MLVAGASVFMEAMLYAVLTPLLPGLVHHLGLSKLSAGIMAASYPAGILLGSIPGGILGARAGSKFTLCIGLWTIAGSTLAFGVLRSAPGLDAARCLQGVGGAVAWAGGFGWVVLASRPRDDRSSDRRGAVIGRLFAAAIAGSLFGPALGAVATVVGRTALFAGVAVLAAILAMLARTLPDNCARSGQPIRVLVRTMRSAQVAVAAWLTTLPAIIAGMINVLGPLRLNRLGAGTAGIAATFVAASALGSAISPTVGRVSDRYGRLAPLRLGMGITAITLVSFTLPDTAWVLGLLIVMTVGALATFWTPSTAMVSDVAEAKGVDQALAVALVNIAWALGQILGAGGGGAAAHALGDVAPTAAAATACLLTLIAVSGARPWFRPELTPEGEA
jgi:MFS family permease